HLQSWRRAPLPYRGKVLCKPYSSWNRLRPDRKSCCSLKQHSPALPEGRKASTKVSYAYRESASGVRWTLNRLPVGQQHHWGMMWLTDEAVGTSSILGGASWRNLP